MQYKHKHILDIAIGHFNFSVSSLHYVSGLSYLFISFGLFVYQNFYAMCFGGRDTEKKQSDQSISGHPVLVRKWCMLWLVAKKRCLMWKEMGNDPPRICSNEEGRNK